MRLSSGNIGTVTANVTNTFGLGGISDVSDTANTPGHSAYIDEITVGCMTVPIDSDGTYLLNVKKYDAAAASAVSIVTGFDMETLVSGKTKRATLVTTLTDSQRVMHFGDFIHIELVSNSAAIDTQMVAGNIGVLLKVLI